MTAPQSAQPAAVVQVLDWLAPRRKAITAAIAPGIVTVVYALQDGHVSGGEWGLIVSAVLLPGGAVYVTPKNKPPR